MERHTREHCTLGLGGKGEGCAQFVLKIVRFSSKKEQRGDKAGAHQAALRQERGGRQIDEEPRGLSVKMERRKQARRRARLPQDIFTWRFDFVWDDTAHEVRVRALQGGHESVEGLLGEARQRRINTSGSGTLGEHGTREGNSCRGTDMPNPSYMHLT